jgi:DNA modification methylase
MMKINCSYTELVEVHKLVPNPKNPNIHPKEQIERLAQIISFQGQRHPVIVSLRSGFVVVGHGRLEAIKKLGWEKIAVDYQDFETEAQEYAFVVSDNAIAEWATLDLSAINNDITEFGPDFNIDLLGIDGFTLDVAEKLPPSDGDPDYNPVIDHAITFKGDVWLLGPHRLMCGDSTMIDEVDKLMNGHKADMVFTDPPYGVNFQSNHRKGESKFDVLKNDDTFLDFIPCLEVHTKDNCPWFIWTSQSVYPTWREMFEQYYKSTIIWAKGGYGMGDLTGDYAANYEMALFCKKGDVKFHDGRPAAIWEIKKDAGAKYVHPTQKPFELAEYAVSHFFERDALVLDLFLGSGSTLIACHKNNNVCFGMELDEKYCDVIIKRWEAYSGMKATLESTGQTYDELKLERDSR